MKRTNAFPLILIGSIFLFSSYPVWADSNSVHIWQEGGYRYIQSNGIPDHAPGQFPNPGNPNSISSKHYTFRIPLGPKLSGGALDYGHDLFGVALNGVPFDPASAEYWNGDRSSGWNYEALSGKIDLGLDQSNAHVQPDGAYHYHGIPAQFLKRNAPLELVGYAADGFPIYYDGSVRSSYRLKAGTRPSGPGGHYDGTFVQDYEYVTGAGSLDACNGRTGATPEYPEGIYHYYLTQEFPFVPRCFKGEPDASFKKVPHGQRPGSSREHPFASRPPAGGIPPEEAISACSNKSEGVSCSFLAPHGTVTGTCRSIQGVTACVPSPHH